MNQIDLKLVTLFESYRTALFEFKKRHAFCAVKVEIPHGTQIGVSGFALEGDNPDVVRVHFPHAPSVSRYHNLAKVHFGKRMPDTLFEQIILGQVKMTAELLTPYLQ